MTIEKAKESLYDAIIIGSGFGGSMVSRVLVQAGFKVLMLERGDWVPRGPHNWASDGSVDLTPFYTFETPYRVTSGGNRKMMGGYSCVGGPSVFYGGVSMRYREADFETNSDMVGDSEARWPFSYEELEPYYSRAEHILNVAGEAGRDLTEPYRSEPYPQSPNALSHTSRMVERAACELGLNPFRIPLAINYSANGDRGRCIGCTTCDTYACAVEAKNDLATGILPELVKEGLQLNTNTVVTRLVAEGKRIVSLECHDKGTGERRYYRARLFVLSAGAIASPHLLLSSDLQHANPGGQTVGRYLMRHCNGIVFGFFPRQPNRGLQFHKQLAIHDFYFGHSTIKHPAGKLGGIQQLQTPPIGLVKSTLPKPLGQLVSPGVKHLTGLLVLAEDCPQFINHVAIDWRKKDAFGLPQLTISHRYTSRDCAARDALIKKSKQILRRAGAWFFYVHKIKTFSHAVGTVRFGEDPATSALDPYCRFRGVENLYVVDGSFMPTSAGLNPSLTIAANALRVGDHAAQIL